jgi:hypothetical protein
MTKILCFLQNQWFKDPDNARAIFARHPEHRRQLIARFLYAGCLTGKILREAWGHELIHAITYENASPLIGGRSDAAFPADLEHMKKAIEEERPWVVVALGKTAQEALKMIIAQTAGRPPNRPTWRFAFGPHPASRGPLVPGKLRQLGAEIQFLASLAQRPCFMEDYERIEHGAMPGLCRHRRYCPIDTCQFHHLKGSPWST